MIVYRTTEGLFAEHGAKLARLSETSFDVLIARDDLNEYLASAANGDPADNFDAAQLQAPIENQEVWAAGVTYYRSRSARMDEAKDAGGGDFYDRVYSAERPELFFKSMPHKVAGPGSEVKIRSDARWSVPEPELALCINPRGEIVGYTVGNDMSSRDIEGANPLYLPQAKVYDRSCALGPGVLIQKEPMPKTTEIDIQIERRSETAFTGRTTLAEMKRDPQSLVEYLFRDHSFPFGCFLLTGTGIVPPDDFTLQHGDEIRITISGIGTLYNRIG